MASELANKRNNAAGEIQLMRTPREQQGYSLIELLMAAALSVLILGLAVAALTQSLQMRSRAASTTDAITSTQAALNVVTREIGNSGFGLTTNGIVVADSNSQRLHFRANIFNNDAATDSIGEDVTFFCDNCSPDCSDASFTNGSVVRYDKFTNQTVGVINRVSCMTFRYYDYSGSIRTGPNAAPTSATGRVEILLKVFLPEVQNQPTAQTVTVTSDVTLRNSPYMRGQY